MRSSARGQHYVPEMLQNAFATPGNGKKPQVYVFDKHEDRIFRTSPQNILHERDFNTFEQEGMTYCLEDGMAAIEDRAAPVLRQVIADRSLAKLENEARAALIVFAALQYVRGVSTRAMMIDMDQQIRERFRVEGQDPDAIPQLKGGNDPEQVKLNSLAFVGRNLDVLSQSFANKVMLLIEAAPNETFLLGDTPVALANDNDTRPYGNLGLEVKGIQIYLPVAPDLTLGFWCPSILEFLRAGAAEIESSLRSTAAAALLGIGSAVETIRTMRRELLTRKARLDADLAAIHMQTPIASDHDNMDYYNSLQVTYAERYLLSSTADFSLPQRMLAATGRYRTGSRWEIV